MNTKFFPIGGTAIRTLNFARAIKDHTNGVRIVTWQPADEDTGLKKIYDIVREGIVIDTVQINHSFLKRHFRFLYFLAVELEYFFFVRKIILEREPDIIHCANETFWLSILLKRLFKKTIIADIHGKGTISIIWEIGLFNARIRSLLLSKAKGLSRFFETTALRIADNSVDIFVCPTEELRGCLISSGISSPRVKAIANAISRPEIEIGQSRARVRATLGLSEETTVVAFHGVLNTKYNLNAVYCLRRISRIVNKKLKNRIKFLIMGYYDDVPVCDENFIYTGYVENLFEYLSAADFAVIPIFDNSLGMRSRLLDYFMMSIPVITTPIGVTGMEFAQKSGAVIVRDDVEALAQSTIELACSQKQLKEMAKRSKDVVTWFSPAKIAGDLLSVYLLASH